MESVRVQISAAATYFSLTGGTIGGRREDQLSASREGQSPSRAYAVIR